MYKDISLNKNLKLFVNKFDELNININSSSINICYKNNNEFNKLNLKRF